MSKMYLQLCFLLLTALPTIVLGQTSNDSTYVIVDQMPEYPGGVNALLKFLATHTVYPPTAKENGDTGTVYVQFVVNKTGKVEQVKTIKGVTAELDSAAEAVVSSIPDWKPGKQKDKPVSVYYTIPIRFVFDIDLFADASDAVLDLVKKGDLDEALVKANELVKNFKDISSAYMTRSVVYNRMNNRKLSCKDLEKALKLGNKEAQGLLDKYCK